MIEIKFDKESKKAVAYDGDNKIGECEYVEVEEQWNIMHTEVNVLYQGQGIARKLVNSVIENSKKYDKIITADCSYAKKIIEKNN